VTQAPEDVPEVNLADPLRAVSRSLARYGIAVAGMIDDPPATLAAVRKALRPIDDYREAQARRASSGDVPEAPPSATSTTPVPEVKPTTPSAAPLLLPACYSSRKSGSSFHNFGRALPPIGRRRRAPGREDHDMTFLGHP